ncbi:MAG TPA: hypothetical protein VNM45_09760 [Bacillus sp. (in: firmicutes)]|nr:hypothetical protein [Bacillus sp. (in: firmicutes)]
MSNKVEEFNNLPQWFQRTIPLISVLLSVLAFSYIIYLYNQASLELVHWVRIIIFAMIGVVLLLSSIIYVFNKESAWKGLIGGLALLPILLFLQLILLLIKIIKMIISSIFQGTLPEPVRIFIENYPSKFDIVILSVLFIGAVLWIIDKLRSRKK